jgi:NCAIR mutase (PurE)-related protein
MSRGTFTRKSATLIWNWPDRNRVDLPLWRRASPRIGFTWLSSGKWKTGCRGWSDSGGNPVKEGDVDTLDPDQLRRLLDQVRRGETSPEDALARLRRLPYESMDGAAVDHHRQLRCGFPEVIFAPGKTPDQVVAIAGRIVASGQTLLITRADADLAEFVLGRMEGLEYNQPARALFRRGEGGAPPGNGHVGVVSAGTSDIPVAEEAAITADLMGASVTRIYDVGVAGLHRLLSRMEDLSRQDALVVAAGMEGALPSVVGGLVSAPVVAVPTSVGYGASLSGRAALLGMLNSCASGVVVVNIDNGFGAGYAAALMARKRAPGPPDSCS